MEVPTSSQKAYYLFSKSILPFLEKPAEYFNHLFYGCRWYLVILFLAV